MVGVYLLCALVGGGLALFSLVGGDSDDGFGEASDVDTGGGHGVAGELLLGFFRARNLTFLLAAFGVTGLLGGWLGWAPLPTALAALGLGLAAALMVHGVFTWLRRTDSAADVLEDGDLEGSLGRVVVPVTRLGRGRIVCEASGRELYLTARLADGAEGDLPIGTNVVILRMEAGVAGVAAATGLELSSSTD